MAHSSDTPFPNDGGTTSAVANDREAGGGDAPHSVRVAGDSSLQYPQPMSWPTTIPMSDNYYG